MICKKVTKEKCLSKPNSTKGQKNKQVIKNRSHCATQSSPSGAKNIKSKSKKRSHSIHKKKAIDKGIKRFDKSKPSKQTKQSNATPEAKTKKSSLATKKDTKTNNSKKSSKINKIKKVAKKVKSKTSDKVKLVIKRNLRNNTKIKSDPKPNGVKHRKMKDSSDCRNKNVKQIFDTNTLNTKNNEKLSVKHVSQKSSKYNLCSKLFPTLDSNKSANDNKRGDKLDSRTRLRNHIKTFSDSSHKVSQTASKSKEINNKEKIIKKKSVNDSIDSSGEKSKKDRNDKQTKSAKQKGRKTVKEKKASSKTNRKVDKSSSKNNKLKSGLLIEKRGHRLASLNAIVKVRLLCENDTEKSGPIDRYGDRSKDKKVEKKEKEKSVKHDGKTVAKTHKCEPKSKKNYCKALVPVDNRKTVAVPRKRKVFDDCVEIIDTRSCKRMASLNASAIMAASYLPERIKRSKSVESNHSNNSVEMVREMQTFSQTVSRYEISPSVTAINGIYVNQVSHQNSVILSAQKHETIETVKQLKVSNKIKDRLLGIARLERQEKAKQKRLEKKSKSSLQSDDQASLLNPEMAAFQATKVQVTKVTHINASQGVKCTDNKNKNKDKKKSGHQINSILETDSSIVHKYQVQTKSTIQMQTTLDSTGSTIANVTTLTAPPATAMPSTAPRMQIHLAETPMMPTPGPGQPTYYSLGTASPAVVQVHNNFQAFGQLPSTSALNPMPIINLSEPYPPHYSSAFSVPHFATHTHPTQNPFTYLNAGLYQPAGPMLQGFQDPCLIHKPIPFHPPTPQVNHIHTTPQFSSSSQSGQTFASDLSQPFAASPQFYPQMQTPLRGPQTVFFHAMPQTNGTAFTLLNPGVHYSQPTFISEPMATNRENPILTNENNFLDINKIISDNNNSNNSNVMIGTRPNAQTSNVSALRTVSTSSQCSPQTRDQSKKRHENCDSVNISNETMSGQQMHQQIVIPNDHHQHKKTNKSDKNLKKRKSLLLNPSSMRNNEEVVRNNRNTCSQASTGKQSICESGERSGKTTITPLNSNKTNSVVKHKNMKTVCVQISPSLPSVVISSAPSTHSESSSERQSASKKAKKRFSHGWSWEGSPLHKQIYLNVIIIRLTN